MLANGLNRFLLFLHTSSVRRLWAWTCLDFQVVTCTTNSYFASCLKFSILYLWFLQMIPMICFISVGSACRANGTRSKTKVVFSDRLHTSHTSVCRLTCYFDVKNIGQEKAHRILERRYGRLFCESSFALCTTSGQFFLPFRYPRPGVADSIHF